MVANLIHFLSFTAIAILSFIAIPANALSIESSAHIARHHAIARNAPQNSEPLKKKRSTGRCQARAASSSILPAPSSTTPPSPPSSSNPAPSPSPSPSPTTSPSSGATSKVGIAWDGGNDPSLKNFAGPGQVVYTWSPYKPDNLYGATFAAMLWGKDQVADWNNIVVPGYASYCMGMNEPNLDSQSGLDPETAAAIWSANIQPLKNSCTLVTPATASASNSKSWMQEFFAACGKLGCTFDTLAMHWYGLNATDFINYVQDFHATFNMNIMVTEVACQNFAGSNQASQDEVNTFMETITAWMDSTPYVTQYFYFGVLHNMDNVNPANQLMNAAGDPTPLGEIYLANR